MTSSVDGLVSGLSTSSMISQLIKVEAAPQDRLKTKVSNAQTAVSSYQSVNLKVTAFNSAAGALTSLATWRGIKASSSSPSVTAITTSANNTTSGSLTFDVTSLATKQSSTMKVTTFVDGDGDGKLDTTPAPITQATSITVNKGAFADDHTFTPSGDPITIDISADQSANGIAAAINKANIGVTAYVMKTADGEGVLQINSSKTGADNGFTIDGLDNTGVDGTSLATTYPTSAELKVNGGGDTTYAVRSNTNTFANMMAGVTLNVTKKDTAVTVDVTSDVDALADKFQAMVDAANATMTEIGAQTAYDPATKKGSPLTGDFSVRDMSQKILSSITGGLSWTDDGASEKTVFGPLAKFGISLNQQTGAIDFDRSKLIDAYSKDPGSIQKAGIKLGEQMQAMTKTMTTNIGSIMNGRKGEIDNLTTQIENWDVRLASKRVALQKTYSDLEVSLGKLKDKSSWLAGQLG